MKYKITDPDGILIDGLRRPKDTILDLKPSSSYAKAFLRFKQIKPATEKDLAPATPPVPPATPPVPPAPLAERMAQRKRDLANDNTVDVLKAMAEGRNLKFKANAREADLVDLIANDEFAEELAAEKKAQT